MKTVMRLALPPLGSLAAATPVAYALLGRDRRVLRADALPLEELAPLARGHRVEAVLHPADTVVTDLVVPPVPRRQMATAVAAMIEPLTLSSVQDLAVGHTAREADGRVAVAWTDKAQLARAWRQLSDAGLSVHALLPTAAVLPDDDARPELPLSLPADARWQGAARRWSLALPALRPAAAPLTRWHGPLRWAAAAAVIWLVGLNLHASQLRQEAAQLRTAMQQQVRQAFPDIPVVVDPVKQATQRRDSLRAAQGTASENDFLPLALSAAKLLPPNAQRLAGLRYDKGTLDLTLLDDEGETAAPDAAPVKQAAALGLALSRTETGWRIARAGSGAGTHDAGGNGSPRIQIQQGGRP